MYKPPLSDRQLCIACRRKRALLEEQLIEEEVARRVKEEVEARVRAAMGSDAVQQSLQTRLEAERKELEQQVQSLQFLFGAFLGANAVTQRQACMYFWGFALRF
jgi:hypothetical protein